MCCNINDFTPHRAGQHSVFTSAENRCTHVGKNKNRHMIRQFKVDGEVVAAGDMSPRCDYLLLNDDAKTSYYIELKGSDLVKAIEQIETTVAMTLHSGICSPAPYRFQNGYPWNTNQARTLLEKEAWKYRRHQRAAFRGNDLIHLAKDRRTGEFKLPPGAGPAVFSKIKSPLEAHRILNGKLQVPFFLL